MLQTLLDLLASVEWILHFDWRCGQVSFDVTRSVTRSDVQKSQSVLWLHAHAMPLSRGAAKTSSGARCAKMRSRTAAFDGGWPSAMLKGLHVSDESCLEAGPPT